MSLLNFLCVLRACVCVCVSVTALSRDLCCVRVRVRVLCNQVHLTGAHGDNNMCCVFVGVCVLCVCVCVRVLCNQGPPNGYTWRQHCVCVFVCVCMSVYKGEQHCKGICVVCVCVCVCERGEVPCRQRADHLTGAHGDKNFKL